jgi:hypothetical protein
LRRSTSTRKLWCPRRDSNPHTSRHMDLNHARLPIPPRGQCIYNQVQQRYNKILRSIASRWCPRRDSNPHTSRHMDLNHARLPIPPRGHELLLHLTTLHLQRYIKIQRSTSSSWCPRRDSNPHTLRHMDLNHARLPIPPRGHLKYCYSQHHFGDESLCSGAQATSTGYEHRLRAQATLRSPKLIQ